MQGKYSLTEAAERIGVTLAWINRVQRQAGIGPTIGKKGQKVEFDDDMVEILRRIKVCRLLGFSFDDIKDIYSTEDTLIKAEQALSNEYELSNISNKFMKLFLHSRQIRAVGPLFMDKVSQNALGLLYKDKNMKTYINLISNLCSAGKEILKRKESFENDVLDVTSILKEISENIPENSE